MHAVAIEEGILFGIAECLAELLDEVAFEFEGIVIEQLFRNLDCNVELVRVEDDLVKGRIPEGERRTFLNPRCGGLCGGNVDLMLSACGNHRRKRAQNVLLIQNVDQTLIVFLGNEIAAVCIHAFLQDVLHLPEIRTQCLEHCRTVCLACTPRLFRRQSCPRSVGDRRCHRLCELRVENRLTLHALDVLPERKHLILHLLVRFGILCRKTTVLFVRIQELLCLFPHFCTLLAHCRDLIHDLFPSVNVK